MRGKNLPKAPFRRLTILAQDPGFKDGKGVLTAQVAVPAEDLEPGPRGYRVHVIDLDSSTNVLYRPLKLGARDPYTKIGQRKSMLADPGFHAQNVYAIVMATLAAFELALGRRTPWGFAGEGHVLKVLPHAFAEANAFYVRRDEALAFGYFPGLVSKGTTIFACLSHDVVAHETTHALVDGLRPRYMEPSSPDQAAFHEGFADIVALLSILRLEEIVRLALPRGGRANGDWITSRLVTAQWLRDNVLLSIADQMGQEMSGARGHALRCSATLAAFRKSLHLPEFLEPHRRGEVLVAAVMNTFIAILLKRLKALREPGSRVMSRQRVAEEAATVASHLLTIMIRALDYTPPVDLTFADFLSAVLTADQEVYPDDSKHNYRQSLLKVFMRYGIDPVTGIGGTRPGQWDPPLGVPDLSRNRFESMQRDRQEMFRFVWENHRLLNLRPDAYTIVSSVRPAFRVGDEGFPLRETVAEYVQVLYLQARELRRFGLKAPKGMPPDLELHLYGGGALIFDEFGRLKFHVSNHVTHKLQSERLAYLWQSGEFDEPVDSSLRLALLHRQRAADAVDCSKKGRKHV